MPRACPEPSRRACPERGRRGGPRPGSGPPPGNLNAFKHGRTSRLHQRLLQLISEDPEARDMLTRIARMQLRRRREAQRHANRLLIALAGRLREIALDSAAARYENDQSIPPPSDTDPRPRAASARKTTKHPT